MQLTSPISLKSLDSDGQFAGYASVFGVVDSQNDIIVRGAFEKTIRHRAQEIKLLWQHQFSEPVGVVHRIFEDARGLYVEGRLLMQIARAREVHALLKSGAVSGLSIGYTPKVYRYDTKGTRVLSEVALWEISFVTFPANSEAKVTVVESGSRELISQEVGNQEWKKAIATGQAIALSDAIGRARHSLL